MTPDPESLSMVQWLSTLGVGGVLAGIIFYFYRKDSKDSRLTMDEVRADLIRLTDRVTEVVEKNTIVMTENTTVIRALHERDDQIAEAFRQVGLHGPQHFRSKNR